MNQPVLVTLSFCLLMSACWGQGLFFCQQNNEQNYVQASNWTQSDSSVLELMNADQELSLVKLNDTAFRSGCSAGISTGSWSNSALSVGPQKFVASSAITLTQVSWRLAKVNNPMGLIYLEVAADNMGAPGVVLTSSFAINVSTFPVAVTDILFFLTNSIEVSPGQALHFTLKNAGGLTLDATDQIAHSFASTCDPEVDVTAGDEHWINVYAHGFSAAQPSARVTLDSVPMDSCRPIWDFSTFAATTNNSSESGSVLFDVSVSDSSSTPSQYQYTELSQTEVQQLSKTSGRYLHLRAIFKGDGFQDATLGALSIWREYD